MARKYYGEEADKKIFENAHMNAFDYMTSKTESIGNNTALTIFGTEITYNELKRNIYKYE